MGEEIAPALRGTIARQLRKLMVSGHPDGNGPRDYHAVARASHEYAERHGGPTISHQSVYNLAHEQTGNPGVNGLQALANVYSVELPYFFQQEPASDASNDPSPEAETPDAEAVLHRLVEFLAAVLPAEQQLETDQEIADAVEAMGGSISQSQITALRTGQWTQDMREVLGAFAQTVGVRPDLSDCFVDEAVAALVTQDLGTLTALKRMGARTVAMRRVAELDDDALAALSPVLAHLGKGGKRQRM